jgi:tetratricopeptide (TPR) repeat protein
VTLIEVRSAQLQVLAERGEAGRAPASATQLAEAARETAELQQIATGFAAVVQLLVADRRPEEARRFIRELEETRGIRGEVRYAANLPGLVRCALALGDTALAARLVEGVEPRTPLAAHVLGTARAALAEAAGDPAEAAERYAEAARRWHEFGHVPERAYALLGCGRCLAALGRPEAEKPLREARDLFGALAYRPALAEAEALLGPAQAAAR